MTMAAVPPDVIVEIVDVDEAGIVWAGGSYVRRPLSVPFRVAS